MKSAGKARSNGLYRHIRTSKEIIRNLLNDLCYMFYIICFIIIYANNYFCLYEDKKSASLPVASFNISVRGRYTTLK